MYVELAVLYIQRQSSSYEYNKVSLFLHKECEHANASRNSL